jgi:hypothetical protein
MQSCVKCAKSIAMLFYEVSTTPVLSARARLPGTVVTAMAHATCLSSKEKWQYNSIRSITGSSLRPILNRSEKSFFRPP